LYLKEQKHHREEWAMQTGKTNGESALPHLGGFSMPDANEQLVKRLIGMHNEMTWVRHELRMTRRSTAQLTHAINTRLPCLQVIAPGLKKERKLVLLRIASLVVVLGFVVFVSIRHAYAQQPSAYAQQQLDAQQNITLTKVQSDIDHVKERQTEQAIALDRQGTRLSTLENDASQNRGIMITIGALLGILNGAQIFIQFRKPQPQYHDIRERDHEDS
jgi:hypothetical protein